MLRVELNECIILVCLCMYPKRQKVPPMVCLETQRWDDLHGHCGDDQEVSCLSHQRAVLIANASNEAQIGNSK